MDVLTNLLCQRVTCPGPKSASEADEEFPIYQRFVGGGIGIFKMGGNCVKFHWDFGHWWLIVSVYLVEVLDEGCLISTTVEFNGEILVVVFPAAR